MKYLSLLLFLIFFNNTLTAQLSVSPHLVSRKLKKFKKNEIKEFKKTTTVFVLSSIYDKNEYKKILDEVWTVTPYLIMSKDELQTEDYLNKDYSFAMIDTDYTSYYDNNAHIKIEYFTYYLRLKKFDTDYINKKMKKVKSKWSDEKKAEWLEDLLIYYWDEYACVELTPYASSDYYAEDQEKSEKKSYSKKMFSNYSLGFIKNYFQKINNQLLEEKEYSPFKNVEQQEIKALAKDTLFIPENISNFVMKRTVDKNKKKSVLKKYNYTYQYISNDVLSQKILNDKSFYYMKFTLTRFDRFLQIVNSKTGEIVYHDQKKNTMGLTIEAKQINHLNKAIEKALKK